MQARWFGLGLLAITLHVGHARAEEDPGRQTFSAGVRLLQDPDGARYDDALPLFRKAYELTGSWKVLGNLGLCFMKLERYGEAIATYERYLSEGKGDIDPDERAQVIADLRAMQAQKVTLRVRLEGSGSAQLRDERRRPSGNVLLNSYSLAESTTLVIAPGEHAFTASAGGRQQAWSIKLEPGSEVAHTFDLSPGAPAASAKTAPNERASSASSQSPSRVPAYVAGGVTLLLAGGTAVTGVMMLDKRSHYQAINGQPGRSRTELEDAREAANQLGLVSSVLFGATLVGAGVTTWLFVSPPGGARTEQARPALWIAPWTDGRRAGLVAEGAL
jgi:hypothetical protein